MAGGRLVRPRPGAPVAGAEWRSDPTRCRATPRTTARTCSRTRRARWACTRTRPRSRSTTWARRSPGLLLLRVLLEPRLPIEAENDMRVTGFARRRPRQARPRPDSYAWVVVGSAAAPNGSSTSTPPEPSVRGRQGDRAACSTVDTPRSVLLSELPDKVNLDVVGRNLMVHHYPGDRVLRAADRLLRGFWSMRCLDDMYLGAKPGRRRSGTGTSRPSGRPPGTRSAPAVISTQVRRLGGRSQAGHAARFGHVQWLGWSARTRRSRRTWSAWTRPSPTRTDSGRPRHLLTPPERLRGRVERVPAARGEISSDGRRVLAVRAAFAATT